MPAFAALQRAHPDADIDWLVESRHQEIVGLIRGLHQRIVIDTRDAWHRVPAVLRRLRANRYDATLDLQGLLKSAVLARFSGARRIVGFDRKALREPAAALFYRERRAVDDRRHVIRKNLALVSALGSVDASIEFPFDIPDTDVPAHAYALLNPGAAWPNKRWPPARFGEIASWLSARHGLRSLVLWGPGERPLAEKVVAAAAGTADPAPRTTIGDVLALARRATLVVSGDTGPLHLAAAVGAPLVGLYGPTSPSRNGPWQPDDVTVSRFEGCVCHHERRCRRPSPCIDGISVEQVQQAIDRRLARTGVPRH